MPDSRPDELLAEIVRSAADSAPIAPTWTRLDRRRTPLQDQPRVPWARGLVAVAAATVLVVLALLLVPARTDNLIVTDDRTTVTTTSTPTTTSSADETIDDEMPWAEWSDAGTRSDVVLCLVRVTGTEIVTRRGTPPNADLPGYSAASWLVSQLRPNESMLEVLRSQLDLSSDEREAFDRQAVAFAGAEAEEFADAGAPTKGFDALVESYVELREQNPLLQDDPGSCWLERPSAEQDLAAIAETNERGLLRCLVAETLDQTVSWHIDERSADVAGLVAQAGNALSLYPEDDISEIAGIVSDAQAALVEPPEESARQLTDVRARLAQHGLGLGESACPLSQN